MTTNGTPPLASPLPTREAWHSMLGNLTLSLTPGDVAELDPSGLGFIELFGVLYRRPSAPRHRAEAPPVPATSHAAYRHTGFELGAL